LLRRHPGVRGVSLAGSRASDTETVLSDWDLGEHPTYMLMLRGPTKFDLIFFEEGMTPRPPWQVNGETLAPLDAHF
jgi:hypothetical protein